MAALGGVVGPGTAPAPAPAPVAQAKPPVVGNPTFCLLVKNMFDPMTETEEGWELDIKEEMEEVSAVLVLCVFTVEGSVIVRFR